MLDDAAGHDHQPGDSHREPLAPWQPDFRLTHLPRTALLGLIRLYQVTLSRAMPVNTCRFYPSCSRYGFEAVRRYGVLKGGLMAAWRVLRCNPFNPGGYDPVP
ncbi:MAG: membrane protein insertion efficiency factor YidD [Anaerolineales bacterium]|nr:membrane protein insertion efficiency factor YidD [Anaerolineales bacterium]